MFTGIIQSVGTIAALEAKGSDLRLRIRSGRLDLGDVQLGDSIAVNGVCLTVVKRTRGAFIVQAVEENLRKTTLGGLPVGDRVNLERPLLPNTRLGGHSVLGHVDGMGRILSKEVRGSSWHYWIRVPKGFSQHLIPVGSIAVDGIILTMAEVSRTAFAVSIIPNTMEVPTWQSRRAKPNNYIRPGIYLVQLRMNEACYLCSFLLY